MLELSGLDLEEVATALADKTDYEHRWLINPETGEMVFWTSDGGIDGETPVDLDELDRIAIDPLPSYVWYQDMADFAELITDERAGRRLARAIQARERSATPTCPETCGRTTRNGRRGRGTGSCGWFRTSGRCGPAAAGTTPQPASAGSSV